MKLKKKISKPGEPMTEWERQKAVRYFLTRHDNRVKAIAEATGINPGKVSKAINHYLASKQKNKR